jgi:hypothetical protein
MLTIYYFPIDAETLRPVTSENIEQRGARCRITDPSEVRRLEAILASARAAEAVFTNRAVRIKIIDERASRMKVKAIVEKEGGVRIGATDRFIEESALAELKTMVERRCR